MNKLIERKLKPSTDGFSDREIKRAKKKLKKSGVPKEAWYIDTATGPSDKMFVMMCVPDLFTTIRHWL